MNEDAKDKQQTAVEWLWTKATNGYLRPEDFEQAKQMERNQILEFTKWLKENDTPENAEQYFHYSDEDMLNEYYTQTYEK